MPLNASERQSLAITFLKCFGEDAQACGRTMKFIQQFTVGNINLLAETQTAALTYQPFLDAGLSIDAWNLELARYFNATQP